MAVQWTMWRELTCLSSLELRTFHITETVTKPGTFIGKGQGLGECWRNKHCCAFLTADRLSAGLNLSEVMVKPFRSFKKAQKKTKPKPSPSLDNYRLGTKLLSSCYLQSWDWALKKICVWKNCIHASRSYGLGEQINGWGFLACVIQEVRQNDHDGPSGL